MLNLDPEKFRDVMMRVVVNDSIDTICPLLMVVASTEDGRDVRRFMRSVYPATYVSEIGET